MDNTGVDSSAADSCSDISSESDPGSAPPSHQPSVRVGNPISLVTGNKYQKEIDYRSNASRLQFNRHYNSLNSQFNLGFGQGWSTTFSVQLDKSSDNRLDIIQSNGRRLKFSNAGYKEDKAIYRTASGTDGYLLEGEEFRHWYLIDGRVLKFKGPFLVHIDYPGHEFLSLFYKNGKLSEVKDQNARVLRFEYAPGKVGLTHFDQSTDRSIPGHLKQMTLPDGRVIKYQYDRLRNLTRAIFPDNTSRQYHFKDQDFPNALTGITDRNNQRASSWSYDGQGRANRSQRANGIEAIALDFQDADDESGVGATTLTNSLGETTHYQWQLDADNGQALLLSGEGGSCSTCPMAHQYSYNAHNFLESVKTETGLEKYFEYDELGRIIQSYSVSVTGDRTLISERSYQGVDHYPSVISTMSVNPEARQIRRLRYTLDGLPLEIHDSGFSPVNPDYSAFEPIERTIRFAYDSGKLVSVDGPRSDVKDVTRFFYDKLQRLLRIEQPDGRVIRIVDYDSSGRPVEYQSGEESSYYLKYSEHNNISSISYLGNRVEYQYDNEGRLSGVTDPDGRFIKLSYDQAGRLIQIKDERQRELNLSLDSESRHIGTNRKDGAGHVYEMLSYIYDAKGRLGASKEDVQIAGNSSLSSRSSNRQFGYDNTGRLASIGNQAGETLSLNYDNSGQLFELVKSSSGSQDLSHHRFEYDNKGQYVGFVDGRNNQTRFIKDDFGRVVFHRSPDTGLTTYRYDESGNRIEKVASNGAVVSYQWDAADRMIAKKEQSDITRYQYDPNNGRLANTSNSVAAELFEYSRESQLIKHTRKMDGREFVTEYSYDQRGKLQTKTLADGTQLQFHYHSSGSNRGTLRAITRRGRLGFSQEVIVGEIDLDRRDGSSGYLSPGGVRTQHRFASNEAILATEISNTLALEYRYDAAGQIIGIDENGIRQQFTYDSGQVSTAGTLTGNYQYQYDATGNRTGSIKTNLLGNTEVKTYQYPKNGQGNRLLRTSTEQKGQSGSSNSYSYNSEGSPVQVGTLSYQYDINQRPIEVYRDNKLIAEYAYNSFGERVRKITWRGDRKRTTWYLYDGRVLTAEVSDDDSPIRHYVYVDDYPAALIEGKAAFGVHVDHLGTPRQVTDSEQNTVWQARYEPFGAAIESVTAVTFNLRLPGQYLDRETGTHYNYYRDYDPSTGRYLTSDPVGLKGGLNTYAYVNNSPLLQTDRLGLAPDDSQISIDGVDKPIADTTYMERLEFVVLEAGKVAGGQLLGVAQEMVSGENLRNMALMMGAIAALQAFPATAAVVDTILVGWAWWNFGTAGVKFIWNLIKAGVDLIGVNSFNALCGIAQSLGSSLADFGEAALDVVDRFSQKAKSTAENNNIAVTTEPVRPDTPTARPPDPPSGYTVRDDGAIVGPNNGIYQSTGETDLNGNQIYVNSGHYYVFKDGKKEPVRSPHDVENHVVGLVGEVKVDQALQAKDWEPMGGTRETTGNFETDLNNYVGQTGIDGIYTKQINGETHYIIVETKASTSDTAGGLNTLTGEQTSGQMQLSNAWLMERLKPENSGLSVDEYNKIVAELNSPNSKVKRVKADVTNVQRGDTDAPADGTGEITYTEYVSTGANTVEAGSTWDP